MISTLAKIAHVVLCTAMTLIVVALLYYALNAIVYGVTRSVMQAVSDHKTKKGKTNEPKTIK